MISLTNATTLHTNFSEIALLIVEYILVSPNTIEEYLKKLGFKKITLRRNRFVFKNPMINFIVKRPAFLQADLPEQAVPTIFLGDGWVMQPVVKTDTESRRQYTMFPFRDNLPNILFSNIWKAFENMPATKMFRCLPHLISIIFECS